jgi:hypothetical protein
MSVHKYNYHKLDVDEVSSKDPKVSKKNNVIAFSISFIIGLAVVCGVVIGALYLLQRRIKLSRTTIKISNHSSGRLETNN